MALESPQQMGDQLNPVDIENHTMIVTPVEYVPHIQTIHTKPNEQSPAIRVNVVDLSDPSGVPVMYNGVLWFNQLLYGNLKKQIGATLLGRMVKGTASPGRNAPWQLADIMAETAWVDYANSWLGTPLGQEWEVAQIAEVNRVASQAPAAPPVPVAQAAYAPPAAQAPPVATPPPAPPAAVAAVAAPAGPPPLAGPPVAAVAQAQVARPTDLAALLANLPAEEQARMAALIAAQGQASS